MKFYFCEGCGRRITEADLASGAGKDKKLKGVFCKGCAEGVLTLETLPLTPEKAKEIIQALPAPAAATKETSPPLQPARRPRATSALHLPPALRKEAVRTDAARVPDSGAKPGRPILPLPLLLAGAAILLLGLALLGSSALRSPAAKETSKASTSSSRDPALTLGAPQASILSPPPSENTHPLSNLPTSASPSPVPQPAPNPGPFARLEAELAARPPTDFPGRIRLAMDFLDANPAAPEQVRLRRLLEAWRAEAAKSPAPTPTEPAVQTNDPKAQESGTSTEKSGSAAGGRPQPGSSPPPQSFPPTGQEPPPGPSALAGTAGEFRAADGAPPPAHERFFLDRLDRLLKALESREYEQAAKQAKELADAPEAGPWRAAGAALPESLDLLQKQRTSRLAALKRQIGCKLELPVEGRLRQGVVTSIDEQGLSLEQRFAINGQQQGGLTIRVLFANIPAETLGHLAPLPNPTSASEWAAAALGALAARNLPAAEESLKHCPGHPLEEPLRGGLARHAAAALEQAAQAEWRLLANRNSSPPSPSQTEKLLADLGTFEERYARTGFAQSVATERAALRDSLEKRTLRSQKLLGAFFHCRVANYNAQSGRATFHYDFQQQEQALDFAYLGQTSPRFAGGTASLSEPGTPGFFTDRFELDGIGVAFKVKTPDAKTNFKLVLGNPPALALLYHQGELELLHLRAVSSGDPWQNPERLKLVQQTQSAAEQHIILNLDRARFEVSLNGTPCYSASDPKPIAGNRIRWSANNLQLLELRELSIQGIPNRRWLQSRIQLQSIWKSQDRPVNLWQAKGPQPGRWSDPQNWSLRRAPRQGDHVSFRGGPEGPAHCQIGPGELAAGLASLTSTHEFVGKITLDPEFGEGRTQILQVDGPLWVYGGEWRCSGLVKGTDDLTGTGVTLKAHEFVLGPAAFLHANQLGFPAGQGPRAACEWGWLQGDPYNPSALGAGGDDPNYPNGSSAGGGAIRIDAGAGTLRVDGILSANGIRRPEPGEHHWGGGGGSIQLLGKTLLGSGRIETRGGDGSCGGAAACGGRIAVQAEVGGFSGSLETRGGQGGVRSGRVGSLVLPPAADLTVSTEVGLPPGQHRFRNLVIKAGGRLVCHPDWQKGSGVWIQAQEVTIESGGALTADGEGYLAGKGPESYPNRNPPNASRDTPSTPLSLGSGSMRYSGGGAIRLDTGSLRLLGRLSANGQGEPGSLQYAGSGGSLWINCGTLEGQGTLEAKGDRTPGKIAVYFKRSEFKGECSAEAFGRSGKGQVLIQPR